MCIPCIDLFVLETWGSSTRRNEPHAKKGCFSRHAATIDRIGINDHLRIAFVCTLCFLLYVYLFIYIRVFVDCF